MVAEILDGKIKKLSPEEIDQVMRFVDDILNSHEQVDPYKPTFNWGGGLAALKGQYTSIELQKKSNEWLAGNI